MYKDLMPLGSVVDIKEYDESIMICGRVVGRDSDGKIYDYVGVPYPVGLTDPDNMLFFNNDSIENIDFIGCKNAIENEFKTEVLSKLDDAKSIKIVDGQIVSE